MSRNRASRSAPASEPGTINLASLPRAPVQEATTPPQGNRRRVHPQTFWGYLSVGCTRASDDGGLLPSRFPTLSVTAAISDTERRKKFNSLIKFGGEDAQDESVPEGEDPGQQRSAGFLELNHFLCDGKEFRDLSYCSNKKYLAGLPPTEPSGRNIGYFQANLGTMETGILAANALRNLLVSNGTHGLL